MQLWIECKLAVLLKAPESANSTARMLCQAVVSFTIAFSHKIHSGYILLMLVIKCLSNVRSCLIFVKRQRGC